MIWGGNHIKLLNELGIKYPTTSGIYKIKNIINDKVYVGSAVNLDRRIKKHMWELMFNRHRNKHLFSSIIKYGSGNFYFIVLELCDRADLKDREQYWIDHYRSFINTNGYNIQPTAFSNSGNSLSEETKNKISDWFKGRPKTKEHNLKNSISHLGDKNAMFGKKISEKLRNAIIESNRKRASRN